MKLTFMKFILLFFFIKLLLFVRFSSSHHKKHNNVTNKDLALRSCGFSTADSSALLSSRPASEDDKQTEEQRSALPHLYVPTQPAHCAVTKCCCSSCEPIKTLPLLQPINSALHQLPCLFISNVCMDFLVLLPL